MRMGRDADEIRKDEMVDGEQRAHREDEEDIEEHRADAPMLLPPHTQTEREREREREGERVRTQPRQSMAMPTMQGKRRCHA
jgi:hypothetical protein